MPTRRTRPAFALFLLTLTLATVAAGCSSATPVAQAPTRPVINPCSPAYQVVLEGGRILALIGCQTEACGAEANRIADGLKAAVNAYCARPTPSVDTPDGGPPAPDAGR